MNQQNNNPIPDDDIWLTIDHWPIEKMTGYKPKTTFWEDFSIAEKFGEKEIRDLYKRAMKHWSWDKEYVTELVMVLNWKIWKYFDEHNLEMMHLYEELWEKADSWCMENLKGDDLDYYLRTTD